MIRPPGRSGVAFTEAEDGDQFGSYAARSVVAGSLGVSGSWATVRQVHGADVLKVSDARQQGDADALWTTEAQLPLAVFTADCFGLVLHAQGAVGVAHAGWRGVSAGVVGAIQRQMSDAGYQPLRAEVGPGIGPCCFEVGSEVVSLYGDFAAATNWDTPSVDLARAISIELSDLDLWFAGGCTMHDAGWFSHRTDATPKRLATIGWRE